MPACRITVLGDDAALCYLRAGNGPPVLLLHGLLGGSFCWRFAAPALARHCTTYTVDMAGLALSHQAELDCGMSAQARRLLHFIEQNDLKEITVVGSSFGGAVAMLMAADGRASKRIVRLVLCAPVNPWSQFGRGRIRFLSTPLGGYFLRALLPFSGPFHGLAVRRVYGDPARMPLDTVEGYRRSVLQPGRAPHVVNALRLWEQDLESVRKAIPQIEARALLIWGDRDQAVDPRSAIELRRALPRARLEFIHGAGHLTFEESPDEFNRLVLQFLNQPQP